MAKHHCGLTAALVGLSTGSLGSISGQGQETPDQALQNQAVCFVLSERAGGDATAGRRCCRWAGEQEERQSHQVTSRGETSKEDAVIIEFISFFLLQSS